MLPEDSGFRLHLTDPCYRKVNGRMQESEVPKRFGCGKSGGDGGSKSSDGDGVKLDVIISQYGNYTQDWWTEFEKTFEEYTIGKVKQNHNSQKAGTENSMGYEGIEQETEIFDLNIEIVSWNDIYSVVNTRISSNEQPDILNISGF